MVFAPAAGTMNQALKLDRGRLLGENLLVR
jgi:hypothetical protein